MLTLPSLNKLVLRIDKDEPSEVSELEAEAAVAITRFGRLSTLHLSHAIVDARAFAALLPAFANLRELHVMVDTTAEFRAVLTLPILQIAVVELARDAEAKRSADIASPAEAKLLNELAVQSLAKWKPLDALNQLHFPSLFALATPARTSALAILKSAPKLSRLNLHRLKFVKLGHDPPLDSTLRTPEREAAIAANIAGFGAKTSELFASCANLRELAVEKTCTAQLLKLLASAKLPLLQRVEIGAEQKLDNDLLEMLGEKDRRKFKSSMFMNSATLVDCLLLHLPRSDVLVALVDALPALATLHLPLQYDINGFRIAEPHTSRALANLRKRQPRCDVDFGDLEEEHQLATPAAAWSPLDHNFALAAEVPLLLEEYPLVAHLARINDDVDEDQLLFAKIEEELEDPPSLVHCYFGRSDFERAFDAVGLSDSIPFDESLGLW